MWDSEAEFEKSLAGFRPLPSSAREPFAEPVLTVAPGRGTPAASAIPRKQKKDDWWALGKFFRVPWGFFRCGLAGQIGPRAAALYVALCDQANKRSSICFSVGDRTIEANTGLARRTIIEARKTLEKSGLITFKVIPGKSVQYTLVKVPEIEISAFDRPRPKKKPRGRTAPKSHSPVEDEWDGLPQILRGLNANYARPCARSAHQS